MIDLEEDDVLSKDEDEVEEDEDDIQQGEHSHSLLQMLRQSPPTNSLIKNLLIEAA